MSTMELGLSGEQELLRETAARFIDATCPLPMVRQLIGSASGIPSGYLRGAGELGWFALLVPEELGGGSVSGEGLRDLAIVAEERGRALQPGPFVGMNVVAAALSRSGTSEQQLRVLSSLCAGEETAAWVFGDAVVGPVPGVSVRAASGAAGVVLSGQARPVPGACEAEWLLVSTDGELGVSQFMVDTRTPGLTVTPLQGLDVTQRYGAVSFDEVLVPPESALGGPGGAEREVDLQLMLACVLSTAETVGAMDALFELTRRYAIDRTAFGRPIGSFQAVKHQLADLSLTLETSKAIAAAAVRAVQDDATEAGEIVSMAKSWVGDAGIDLAQGCAQIFAGIGFTWEHDLHLFLRRITMNSVLFGSPDWHRERICRAHGLSQP
jgi:alkylation response protein AidB-like acyl-CoA dehydrogenase